MEKNPEVDYYLQQGCGRCSLAGTPECKVNTWIQELISLRKIILKCGLTETLKWKVPCYTYNNKNVLLLSAFKYYCSVTFVKGVLLEDSYNVLIQQTENVQSSREIRFTDTNKITELNQILIQYIMEAINLEKEGAKVIYKETSEFNFPKEFQDKLDELPDLKIAFEALTPGRQRGYLLYFSAPKQTQTRKSRIEKSISKIFNGQGIHD